MTSGVTEDDDDDRGLVTSSVIAVDVAAMLGGGDSTEGFRRASACRVALGCVVLGRAVLVVSR